MGGGGTNHAWLCRGHDCGRTQVACASPPTESQPLTAAARVFILQELMKEFLGREKRRQAERAAPKATHCFDIYPTHGTRHSPICNVRRS